MCIEDFMIDPLHQFKINPIINLHIGDLDLSFSNSSLAMVLAVFFIFLMFALGGKNKRIVPGKFQALIEISYKLITSMIDENIGTVGMKYFPFVFCIFFFILFGNLIGMVPFMFTFTSHIIVTFTLAMIVFCFVTLLGFVLHGTKFLSFFVPKGVPFILKPILVPIEILSYFSRPVSLSIRLFANMMAGHTILKVFAAFSVMLGMYGIAPLIVNIALTGFEILVACLQAYVFTILTCLYLNDAVHLH